MGALNLLSRNLGEFTPAEVETLRNFAAAVAIAIENARLFESERRYADTMETLAEIGRDFASMLDLDELLQRIAHHIKRVIDYRTFGILLVNEEAGEVEMRHAVRYYGRHPREAREDRRGAGGLRRRCTRCRCWSTTCRRTRGTSRWWRTRGPSWWCRCS